MSLQNSQKKKQKFLELYKLKTCNISATCEAVGISRQGFYKWLDRDEKFAQAVKDAENSLIDEAEAQLFKNIKEGKETSLIFFLTNRAPERWQDRRHVTNTSLSLNIHLFKRVEKELDGFLEQKRHKLLGNKGLSRVEKLT